MIPKGGSWIHNIIASDVNLQRYEKEAETRSYKTDNIDMISNLKTKRQIPCITHFY